MLQALALVLGAVIGFAGSRKLRRPDRAAQAASVARSVSSAFGGRRTLTPPELQRACFSEMVRHVRVGRSGAEAPTSYVLRLHPEDMAVVDDNRRWFTDGLADALRRAASANGWTLARAVEITFQPDPSRHPGVPSALAVPPDGTAAAPQAAPPPAATPPPRATPVVEQLVLVRADTAQQRDLGRDTITVGRSKDRSIVVDDNRVSRAHARIEPAGDGWTVTDEGSSNGTRVSGRTLEPNVAHRLRPGDVISVGPLDLRVAAKAGSPTRPAAEPGTAALDDRTRIRISSEVLPPGDGPAR